MSGGATRKKRHGTERFCACIYTYIFTGKMFVLYRSESL